VSSNGMGLHDHARTDLNFVSVVVEFGRLFQLIFIKRGPPRM